MGLGQIQLVEGPVLVDPERNSSIEPFFAFDGAERLLEAVGFPVGEVIGGGFFVHATFSLFGFDLARDVEDGRDGDLQEHDRQPDEEHQRRVVRGLIHGFPLL
jgi:hypothetical protein